LKITRGSCYQAQFGHEEKSKEYKMEMIGEIKLFSGDYAPRNWAFCEGQLLDIRSYDTLFSIFGHQYGGDGRTTFALPDLRESAPKSKSGNETKAVRYIIALEGEFPIRG